MGKSRQCLKELKLDVTTEIAPFARKKTVGVTRFHVIALKCKTVRC